MTTKPKPVPAGQYRAMVDRAETAEQRCEQLEAALDDARRGAAADLELLAAQADRERVALRAEVARWRRFDLIRQAATAAQFIDPQDAVARLAEHDIGDVEDAVHAVLALAKDAPHLMRQQEVARPLKPLHTPTTARPGGHQ